ncbi:MAG TPA: SGNH/GDSL hydrolase family protein [Pyrinomonadaceae bacterium]|nr:SGNH/GDSL hydrolase family protein [Pyrinomonadaceae bacterium]
MRISRFGGIFSTALLCALLFMAAGDASAQCAKPVQSQNDPLHMLVIGDSILWGQGLKQERKIWWRIKCWLQEQTGRPVSEKIQAHSGATIETATSEPPVYSSNGEVPSYTPSVNQQVDDALAHYPNRGVVDLILVNGCINDVDVRHLLNSATKLETLETSIKEACGGRMQRLLRRTANEFPRAHLIVPGYYPIFSEETDHNRFIRMLAKKLTSATEEEMSDKEMRRRLVVISNLWYQVSTRSLSEAVQTVNAELAPNPRIHFAAIDFQPEHAFAAPETLLWNFKFASISLSGLRKAIVIVTLGTAAYKTNDQVRELRSRSCKQIHDRMKKKNETKSEKDLRESSYLACRYASLGHPNQMGALIYAESIKGQLLNIISSWRRNALNPIATRERRNNEPIDRLN